jgi:hypothetical protein
LEIFASCIECQKELNRPPFEELCFVRYYDDGIAEVHCSRGHKSALLIQSPKFEVLLESGVNAVAAGFTLEAAASFSAALERFYEYGTQVLCTHRRLPHAVYEQMFKSMSRQSERQLGAFLTLYAIEFGTAYAPNPNVTEFRNSVIHKGLIPEPEKARSFCEKVLGEIKTLHEKLAGKCENAMHEVLTQDLLTRSKSIPENMPRATSSGTFFFAMARTEPMFKAALEEYMKAKQMLNTTVPLIQAFFSAGPPQSTANK